MTIMQELVVDKVTVNIGIGSPGERLEYASELLSRITNRKPVETKAKNRNPVFKLRKGLPIGVKVTLRGKAAADFIVKGLAANKNHLSSRAFDKSGNFSFGVREYIDFPGAKYDPKIGMMGFDICVTLSKRGARVARRRIKKSKVGKKQLVNVDDAKEFVTKTFNAKIE